MTGVKIHIDHREADLIAFIKTQELKDIVIVIENLQIGDVILSYNDSECIILERKSIQDLAASIKDGRYEEQSYRLNGSNCHNHNIVYVIEGDVNSSFYKGRVDKSTIYSAMVSLNYYKGFSVMRTFGLEETGRFVCCMAHKIGRGFKEGRTPFYLTETHKATTEDCIIADKYVEVVKKSKKENLTPENIGEIILCQIPGISSVTAIAILNKYKTIHNLIKALESDPNCLQNMTYESSKGQTRKISKTCLENIAKYLLNI
jgi:ERCC4-type nuclease